MQLKINGSGLMEELVHWMMIYLSNDGVLIKIPLEFARAMTLLECMDFAADHREAGALSATGCRC